MAPQTSSAAEEDGRADIIDILESSIHEIHHRIETLEGSDDADDRLLIEWYRTLGSLSSHYRIIRKDADIDEMEADLELLKEATEVADRG